MISIPPSAPVPFILDSAGNVIGIQAPNGSQALINTPTSAYISMFDASLPMYTNQNALYDKSGFGNDWHFGANLTSATAIANPGYATTGGFVSNQDQSFLLPPSAIWPDFSAGDSIFMFWRGIALNNSANMYFMGNVGVATDIGFLLRANSNSTLNIAYGNGTAVTYKGATTQTPFDGNLHSIAVGFDGPNNSFSVWVDGQISLAGYQLVASGAAPGRGAQPWRIGGTAVGTGTSNQMVTKTSHYHLLGCQGKSLPANINAIVSTLHKFPDKLISSATWASGIGGY